MMDAALEAFIGLARNARREELAAQIADG